MKPDAYLWQLTLNTGHTERRYRHEIEITNSTLSER